MDTSSLSPPSEAVTRTYARLAGQVEWLAGQADLDEPTIARAISAALRGEPIAGPLPAGSRQNVIWRLAFLWGLRGPYLRGVHLVSGPLRLEGVIDGGDTLAAGLAALQASEASSASDLPADLHARLRMLCGPEAASIDELWSAEARMLAPCIAAWRARMSEPAGQEVVAAVIDVITAGVAAAPQRVGEPARPALATVEALCERAGAELPAACFELGRIDVTPGPLTDAAADVAAALRMEPDHVLALHLSVRLRLLRRDDLGAARLEIERAIRLDSGCGELYVTLARLEQSVGQLDAAIHACTRALAAAQPAKPALALRSVLRCQAGDLPGAEADARAAIAGEPTSLAAHWALGQVCKHRGDVDGALATYEGLLKLAPDHAATLLERAQLFEQTGQLARALTDADRAVASARVPDTYYNRGGLRLAMGDLAGSVADFTAALTLNPMDVQALLNRGAVHAMRQDASAALADFDAAANLAPTYAPARLKRALVRMDLGQIDEAVITDLRAALEYAPLEWPARAEVEQILARCERQSQRLIL